MKRLQNKPNKKKGKMMNVSTSASENPLLIVRFRIFADTYKRGKER